MSEKVLNQTVCLKQHLTEKEYKEISELEELCRSYDKTNLKLELDYKLNLSRNPKIDLKAINELLYYVDDILVAYLGISSFGGNNIAEINGMVHPEFRRKGLFKKLFDLAIGECHKRNFKKVLLLSDGNSNSGIGFIKAIQGEYDFAEYRMKLISKNTLETTNSVSLRKAGKSDRKEIARQDAVCFNKLEECESSTEEVEAFNQIIYMVELKEKVIGKIKVDYSENSAFICGFAIMPDFRGKGYGKAALKETLRLINERDIHEIELDVECENNSALNLYKACGFEEKAVMNYYKYSI